MNFFIIENRIDFIQKWLFLVAFCIIQRVYPQGLFTHHNQEGYAQVIFMAQDSSGFLWLGSSDLARYDGYNFVKYRDSLGNRLEGPLTIAPSGDVWSFEPGRINKYDKMRDSFISYNPGVKEESINSIGFDKDGSVWLGSYKHGLFLFNPKDKTTQQFFNWQGDSTQRIQNNWITWIEEYPDHLLLGTLRGLWRFDKQTKLFKRPSPNIARSNFLLEFSIRKIFPGKDNYWFYLPKQLIKTDLKFNIIQHFDFPESITLPGNPNNIDRDKKGIFWIATYGQGLLSFDPTTEKVSHYKKNSNDPRTLSSDILQSVLVDRDQNVWVGSYDKGIDQLKKLSLTFHTAALPGLASPGTPHVVETEKEIFLLQESKTNGLWIAHLPHDLKPIQFKPFDIRPSLVGVQSTNSFLGKDFWWIGTWTQGLIHIPLNKQTRMPEITSVKLSSHESGNVNTISDQSASLLLEDHEKSLWVTSPHDLLHRIDLTIPYGKPGSVVRFIHNPDDSTSISKGEIWSVVPGEGTSKWVLTSYALDLFTDGKFQHIYKRPPESGMLYCLRKVSDGDLIIGGINGLIIGSLRAGKYYFEEVALLQNRFIMSIEEDKKGRLWLSSENGIFCYDRKERKLFQFKEEDGLPSNEFIANASTQTSDGRMIFTSVNAQVLFDPMEFALSSSKIAPVLITLHVNNKPTQVGLLDNSISELFKIPQNISVLKELVLDYKHNVFSLEFSALQLTSPEKNLYQYKLEGFDNDWIQTDWKNRLATYTNLDPGKYIFRVKASNYDHIWSDLETEIAINILPPPWKTWWAYSGYLMLAAGALVLARRNIVQRERLKSNLKLEHLELEKAKEVDRVKTSFFTNISHEFRTPLTLIKGPVQDLMEEYTNHPKTKERLKLIQRNSDLLLKLINQLLDLAKLESGSLKIEKSESDLTAFISAVSGSFSSMAQNKNVELKLDLPLEHFNVLFDKDKLETILINLINNAIKFTPEGGSVTVKAIVEESILLLSIKDTGIGIPKEHQSKIFERFHQVSEAHKEVGTGIGLSLVKELVALLDGEIVVTSEVGKGTEFKVELPVEIGEPVADYLLPIAGGNDPETGNWEPVTKSKLQEEVETSKPHVLVVEDNADLRTYIIDSLGNEFHFLQAADGKQGLEKATAEIPDLIISDVMMPEMDGVTMVGKIRAQSISNHIPIILLTAKSTEESKLSGLESGADDYLTKPFNKNELLLKVRNGISRQLKLREKLRAELMSEAPKVKTLSGDEKFLNKVKQVILDQLSNEQLSVEFLAEEIGISRVQLYRKISGLTGISVNELIRKLRLHHASQLLKQNWGPVSQIAYEVGFSNLSYFSKVFKEEFGVLPSEYGK